MDQALVQYFTLAQRINRSAIPGVVRNAQDRMAELARHSHPIVAKHAARYLHNLPGESVGKP